jgi:uncharacterized protein YqeY
MSLKDVINEKWKEAFKARDELRRNAYELIKQRIMVAEKSGQVELPLSDEYITNLIIKEVKEREDILTFYTPEDNAYTNAKAVIKELSQYLPKQMSEEEVIEIIKRIKATEPNLGKVIGLTVKEVGNRYDKSLIAALVKRV